MSELNKNIEELINLRIRPRVRVDGGDIKFEKIKDGVVYVGAYADCATCPTCEIELAWWIEKKLKKELEVDMKVKIIKYKPYFN